MTAKKRIDYLDCVKGIGIALVVLQHIGFQSDILLKYIHSFHMPLFFLTAGITLRFSDKSNIKNFVCKKAKSLLVPCFVFSVIGMVCTCLDGENFNFILPLYSYNFPVWFLTTIFIMYILIYFLERLTKSSKLLLIVSLTMSFICNFLPQSINEVVHFKTAVVFSGFMALGNLLGEPEIKQWIEEKKGIKIVAAFIFLIMGFILSQINSLMGVMNCVTGNIFLCYISAFCTVFGLLVLCAQIPSNFICKVISFLGRNSLIILGTHWPVTACFTHMIRRVHPEFNRTVLKFPVILLIEVIIILGVEAVKKMFNNNRKKLE